jgi:hypothetical protein
MKTTGVLLLFLSFALISNAQKLTGFWYSADSSRVYEIKELAANKFTAVLRSSSRKKDEPGYVIIKELIYNTRKKRYEGIIYAVSDGQAAFVKIRFDKTNANRIVLKLNRMLVMDVAICWIRADS